MHLGAQMERRWYFSVDNHYRKNKVLVLIADSRADALRAAAKELAEEYEALGKQLPAKWEFTLAGDEPASVGNHTIRGGKRKAK